MNVHRKYHKAIGLIINDTNEMYISKTNNQTNEIFIKIHYLLHEIAVNKTTNEIIKQLLTEHENYEDEHFHNGML